MIFVAGVSKDKKIHTVEYRITLYKTFKEQESINQHKINLAIEKEKLTQGSN